MNIGDVIFSEKFSKTRHRIPPPPKKVSYQPLKSIFGPIFDLHQLEISRALTY